MNILIQDEEVAFLTTIATLPDDLGPRLVYRDWLIERGRWGEAESLVREITLRGDTDDEDLRWDGDRKTASLVGIVFRSVERDSTCNIFKNDGLILTTISGDRYALCHRQDCCESVGIEDIEGKLEDLVGSPLTMAEESTNSDDPPPGGADREYSPESYTWTFYRFATAKGYVTIRFFGSSNGYYAETASLYRLPRNIQ